jgi:hypothetical protein
VQHEFECAAAAYRTAFTDEAKDEALKKLSLLARSHPLLSQVPALPALLALLALLARSHPLLAQVPALLAARA